MSLKMNTKYTNADVIAEQQRLQGDLDKNRLELEIDRMHFDLNLCIRALKEIEHMPLDQESLLTLHTILDPVRHLL